MTSIAHNSSTAKVFDDSAFLIHGLDDNGNNNNNDDDGV